MGTSFSQLRHSVSTKYQSFLWKTFEYVLRWRIGFLLDALWLLGARALPIDPVDGTNPLMHYSLNGDAEHVELLAGRYRDQIASCAVGGQTALHAAATSGSLACVRQLCNNGADVNKQSDRGHSALVIACSMNHIDIVRELLGRGANANLKDIDLKTAQHFSVKSLHATKLILKETKGKLLSARDTNGKTPLMVTIMLGGEDDVFDALMKGIEEYFPNQQAEALNVVNIQSNDGMTALMHACHRGLEKATLQLLKLGSNVTLRDAYGQTALHLCCKSRQLATMSLLLTESSSICNNSSSSPSSGKADEVNLLQMRDDDGLLPIHSIISGLTCASDENEGELACKCMEVLLQKGGKQVALGKDFSDTTALHLLCQTFFQIQERKEQIVFTTGKGGGGENSTDELMSLLPASWYVKCVCRMIQLMMESMQSNFSELLLAEDESEWTCLHYMHEFINKGTRMICSLSESSSETAFCRKQIEVRKPVYDMLEELLKHSQSTMDLSKSKKPKSKYLELRGAYHRIPIEQRDDVLRGDRSLKGVADRLLRTASKPQRVVVLCGAGISTSAGIPDYRSNTGIYKTQAGRDAFSSFHEDPMLFWNFARKTFGPIIKGDIKPTPCHRFLSQLHRNGMLQRIYTQNVDGLEVRAGVPKDKVIQCHGSISAVICSACEAPPRDSLPVFFPQISANDDGGQPPLCELCSSPLRPDVTFFGEPLSPSFFTHQNEDFDECTMLIVMGTTLQVFPFASLVGKPSLLTPRLLINKELTGPFRQLDDGNHKFRDVAYVGDCDDGVKELGNLLGWEEKEWLL